VTEGQSLLTSIVISPQADCTGELSASLSELGHVRVFRTFQQYPSEEELDRFLHIAGPSIVFLSAEDTRRALELALAIDRAGTGTQVVVLSSARDPQVLVECMQVGIREFLSLQLDPDRVYETVCRITDILERKPLAFKTTDALFAFLPAKPGDGASTLAVNVSSAIARRSPGKTLALLGQCREIFLVCTSDVPSLHFARAKVQFLRDSGLLDRASIVINRSAALSSFSIDDMEKLLGLRIRLSLQNDPRRVSNAMREGTHVDPKRGLGRQFEAFATSLVGLDSPSATVRRKRRFIEHFAIVPSDYQASEKKRR
jgi:Flp pilus assembly CpaE family ATPase